MAPDVDFDGPKLKLLSSHICPDPTTSIVKWTWEKGPRGHTAILAADTRARPHARSLPSENLATRVMLAASQGKRGMGAHFRVAMSGIGLHWSGSHCCSLLRVLLCAQSCVSLPC